MSSVKRRLCMLLAICLLLGGITAIPAEASTNNYYISEVQFGATNPTTATVPSGVYNSEYIDDSIIVPDSSALNVIKLRAASGVNHNQLWIKATYGTSKDKADQKINNTLYNGVQFKQNPFNFPSMTQFDKKAPLGSEIWIKVILDTDKAFATENAQTYYFKIRRSVTLKTNRGDVVGAGITASQIVDETTHNLQITNLGNNNILFTPPADMENPMLSDSINLKLTAYTPSSVKISVNNYDWAYWINADTQLFDLSKLEIAEDGMRTAVVHLGYSGTGIGESTDYTLLFYTKNVTPTINKPVNTDYERTSNGEFDTFGGRKYLKIESEKEGATSYQATVFNATATQPPNSDAPQYQWYKNESNEGWQAISGATASTYTPPAVYSGELFYCCKVTNTVTLQDKSFTYTTDSDYIRFIVKPSYCSGAEVKYQIGEANLVLNQANYEIWATADRYDVGEGAVKFAWYRNNTASTEGAQKVTENTFFTDSYDASKSYLIADTSAIGEYYYYCLVTARLKKDNGEYDECVSPVTKFIKVSVISLDQFFEGEGTETNPYKIKTVNDFQTIADIVAGGNALTGVYFEMTGDITLSEDWTMIGCQINEELYNTKQGMNVKPFSGHLDGRGHTLTIPEGGKPLFRYVRDAYVSNLNIYGTQIAGTALVNEYFVDYGIDGSYMAGVPDTIHIDKVTLKSGSQTLLSGFIHGNGSGKNNIYITDSIVESGVTIGYNHSQKEIASFAGCLNGQIMNCASAANVYGTDYVGGIAGKKGQSMGSCTLLNDAFTGNITASGVRVGGILASGYEVSSAPNTPAPSIINCYVSGNITGADYVGGIYGIEPVLEDCWANGIGVVACNAFYGTVTATSGNHLGAISSFYKSFNENQIFKDNYFVEDCGADKALGAVEILIDNSGGLGSEGMVSRAALTDGTLLNLLNTSKYSSKNWIAGSYPIIDASVVTIASFEVVIPDSFQTEYYVGDEEPNYDALSFVLTYSDRTTSEDGTHTALTKDDVIISGFDSSKQAVNTITVTYKGNEVFKDSFQISILKKNPDDVEVSVAILGDALHNSSTDGTVHTLTSDNLTPWIATTTYTLDQNATVKDLFEKLLSDHDELSWENPTGNYIESITYNDVTLGEFTNGANSGWMYTYNGVLTRNGIAEQFLNDGDCILAFYTDDFTKEIGIGESAVKTFTLSADKLELEDSEDAAKNSATLTTSITPTALNGNVKVEWVSADPSVATVKNGVVTAKSVGSTEITATAGGIEKKCTVTVSEVPVASVMLDRTSLELEIGGTATLTATVLPEDAADPTVTWSSSAPEIAAVENGVVTAKATGTAVISATAGGIEAKCTVSVNGAAVVDVTSVTLDQTSLTLEVGETATLKATVLPENATDNKASWTSSATSIATVDENGVVTAKAAGNATITASAGDIEAKCTVTVSEAPVVAVESVTLDQTKLTLKIDETATLKATVLPEDVDDPTVTWTSSAPGIASVESGVVTAKASGVAMITAKAGEREAACKVIVEPKQIFDDNALGGTAKYVYETVTAPGIGDTAGDWVIVGLARSGYEVPNSYYQNYYAKVESTLTEKNGILNQNKYTEYSRVILALTAIGKDPTDVAGYNLLEKLADYDATIYQGVNGPIWALIALDSGNYDIPQIADTANQATRDRYVARILECQLDDGGWAQGYVGGTGVDDPDMTAMALQALAKYRGDAKVDAAVAKALTWLSENQSADGGYSFKGDANVESAAQVIVALNELGIAADDARFVKNGKTLLDNLLTFRNEDGSFRHVSSGTANQMATEQALYALVSVDRAENGKPTLYKMTDPLDISGQQPAVAVTGVTLSQNTASVEEGKTVTLTATVQPTEATDRTVTWESDHPEIATVKDGVVTGVTEGEAVITAKAGEITATCTVTVTKASTPTPQKTKISVAFSLLGDSIHDSDSDGKVHGLKPGGLTMWISKTYYELDEGATVKDLFEEALTDAGMTWSNPSGNYVESITYNGETLGEFTNGKNSGWMYTLNGEKHPSNGVAEQVLEDGDVVTWHYTDDYTKENDAESWGGGGGSSSSNYENTAATAAHGKVTIDPKSAQADETVTVRIQPDEGYELDSITAKDADGNTVALTKNTDSTYSFIQPKAGVTVTATFKEKAKTGSVEIAEGEITARPEVTDGEAKVELTAENMAEALAEAEDAEALTVKVETEDAKSAEVALPAEAAKAVADADKGLTVETENGAVKIDADTLKSAADKDLTVAVKANEDGSTTFDVTAGGETVDAKLKVDLPAEDGQVLVIVNEDGSEELVKKSVVEDGKAYAEIPAGATVKVIDNDKEFVDVADNAWYAEAVEFASSHDLFKGVGDDKFAPAAPMTRAMLATVLYRLEDAVATGTNPFDDVADGTWYTDAVTWANAEGIVMGTGKGFDPNANITREQIATMLYRYAKYLGLDVSGSAALDQFSDGGETASWAQDAMQWAVSAGLFRGDDAGALNPKGDATRAEVATLLMRLVELIVK